MKRLREVVGDNKEETISVDISVDLDGEQISRKELDEKIEKQSNSQKIVEVSDGSYKTLNRMYS